jgi:hypothetical protein
VGYGAGYAEGRLRAPSEASMISELCTGDGRSLAGEAG